MDRGGDDSDGGERAKKEIGSREEEATRGGQPLRYRFLFFVFPLFLCNPQTILCNSQFLFSFFFLGSGFGLRSFCGFVFNFCGDSFLFFTSFCADFTILV